MNVLLLQATGKGVWGAEAGRGLLGPVVLACVVLGMVGAVLGLALHYRKLGELDRTWLAAGSARWNAWTLWGSSAIAVSSCLLVGVGVLGWLSWWAGIAQRQEMEILGARPWIVLACSFSPHLLLALVLVFGRLRKAGSKGGAR